MTHGGGQLHDMLKWVEDILATKGPQSCLFVGVWPFNDFKGNKQCHLPLARLILRQLEPIHRVPQRSVP